MGRGVWAWALVALALLFSLAGCGMHVLGTHDVSLEFSVANAPGATPVDATELSSSVEQRLMAGNAGADVEVPDSRTVRVTVDDQDVALVRELLAWRGGIQVFRVSPETALAPPAAATRDVESRSVGLGPGVFDRYFVGSPDDLERVVAASAVPPGRRVLIEFLAGDSFRTRVVDAEPVLDLSDGVTGASTERGRTLVLSLTPEASTRLERARETLGGAPVAFVRHRAVLAVGPLPRGSAARTLPISLGTEIFAYTRAHNARRLLDTPALPALTPGAARALPVRRGLAAASLILPIVLSFAWLFFVRRFDRARPEPWWLVGATFALGGLSVIPAALLEAGLMRASPYLNPTMMTFGGQPVALPLALVVFTVVVGLSEEGSKFLGAFALARRRREFDEPVDGIVYGAASSLGFAALENVKYFAEGRLSATLVVTRSFLSIPAHLFFGAIWGYALGRSLVSRRARVPLFVLLAALAHGAFDAFLSTDGAGWLALALNLGLASAFVALLRRALRYGAVGDRAGRESTEPRALFPVGSPMRFVLCAVAVHLLAFALFVQGAALEGRHGRITPVFMAVASWLVLSLGLAAYGIAESVPLDAAVDGAGVTFAGASMRWDQITRVTRLEMPGRRARLKIEGAGAALTVGPGRLEVIERLERAVADGLNAARESSPRAAVGS